VTVPDRPRLFDDRRGVTIVEFALVAPVMLLMSLGLADLTYRTYVQSVLTGALQKAGRDSTIQGSATQATSIDTKVISAVQAVAPGATYASTRRSYASFGVVNGEPFTDTSPPSQYANGRYDLGRECFMDTNGNNKWDADPGLVGQGGANDVVVYTMTVTYTRFFPMAGLLGWSNTQDVSAKTVLKNQPYASQADVKQVCP
jgi:Flp pilus assembly protein TadG